MKDHSPLTVLLSQSQVFFQGSQLTGLLFTMAFAVVDVRLALFALLGAVVQSGVSWLVPGVDRQEVVEGKHGFCGALTAAAAFTALGFTFSALVWAVLGSAACAGVVLFMGRFLGVRGIPAMTAPFCVVSGIATTLAHSLQHAPAPPAYVPTDSLVDAVTTLLTSVSQVVLLDNVWSGLLILVGLFAAGWHVGLWAVAGAALASAVGWLLHEAPEVVLNGFDGYSGVLVALAVGTVFLGSDSHRIGLALAGVVLTVPLRLLLAHIGIPVYTWPFILATWAVLLVARKWSTPAARPSVTATS